MVLYPNKLPESERVCSGICRGTLKLEVYVRSTARCDRIVRSLKYCSIMRNIPPKGVICPVFIRILAKSDEGMT